jgi:hypothetical protein
LHRDSTACFYQKHGLLSSITGEQHQIARNLLAPALRQVYYSFLPAVATHAQKSSRRETCSLHRVSEDYPFKSLSCFCCLHRIGRYVYLHSSSCRPTLK